MKGRVKVWATRRGRRRRNPSRAFLRASAAMVLSAPALWGAGFGVEQAPAAAVSVLETPAVRQRGTRAWQVMRVSAYCPCEVCCGRWADGVTASGHKAAEGISVAADPRLFEMGQCLWLRGVGKRTVQDTGSAIVGRRLDLYFDSHDRALEFGVQWLQVRPC